MTREPRERARFVRFVIAAGLSVPVNLGARVLLSRVMAYEAAIVVSHVCGMLTAFALTRAFVFEPSGRSPAHELWRFALVNLATVTQTWIVAVGLVRFVFPALGTPPAPEFVAHAIGLGSASVTAYLGHRRYSFGRS